MTKMASSEMRKSGSSALIIVLIRFIGNLFVLASSFSSTCCFRLPFLGFVPPVRPFVIPLLSISCPFSASSRDSMLEDGIINTLSSFTLPLLSLLFFFSFFFFKSSFPGLLAVFELSPLLLFFSAFDFLEEAMNWYFELRTPNVRGLSCNPV